MISNRSEIKRDHLSEQLTIYHFRVEIITLLGRVQLQKCVVCWRSGGGVVMSCNPHNMWLMTKSERLLIETLKL